MATKRLRIKDIARIAGVSTGTVDRVLHNRNDVSTESRNKVQALLDEIQYKPNLHLSTIGAKKRCLIVIILPSSTKGSYWWQIESGIKRALYEFSNSNIKVKFLHYDQFDLFSCREVYNAALEIKCDAMLIGPTFSDETMLFTSRLSNKDIPYIFVDTLISDSYPLSFFGPHTSLIGRIEAKLLMGIMDKTKDVAIFQAKRIGNESSSQTITRKFGFVNYLKEFYQGTKVLYGYYYNSDEEESSREVEAFFEQNENIGGAVVFNSRAYMISGYLRRSKRKDIALVGCGAIERNIADLKRGYISYLIAERPEKQGYLGFKTILEYLLFNKQPQEINYTPIDILIKENVDYYLNETY
jgi:LacI family transcriptional regulator